MNRTLKAAVLLRHFLFCPAPTGSVKAHRLAVELICRGTQVGRAVEFLAHAAGGDALAVFDYPLQGITGRTETRARGRLRHKKLTISKGDKPVAELGLIFEVVTDQDCPFDSIAGLAAFLLAAAQGDLLKLDVEFRAAQTELPFPSAEETIEKEAAASSQRVDDLVARADKATKAKKAPVKPDALERAIVLGKKKAKKGPKLVGAS